MIMLFVVGILACYFSEVSSNGTKLFSYVKKIFSCMSCCCGGTAMYFNMAANVKRALSRR